VFSANNCDGTETSTQSMYRLFSVHDPLVVVGNFTVFTAV